MPKLIAPRTKDRYIELRQRGNTITQAAREAGVSRQWAHTYETEVLSPEIRASIPRRLANHREGVVRERPVPRDELVPEALASLSDFELFRARYFGRRSTPWQVEAGHRAVELLGTDDKEFVVINCPPGAGKSTLIHDLWVWLVVRDRSVRTLLGSRTERQAIGYSGRVKRTLERRSAMKAKDDELRLGLALDAVAFLAQDFGPFRPSTREEVWRREQFTVVQDGEVPTDEKESTCSAFGMDSGQLGWRVNATGWDDLVDRSTVRTEASIEAQREWWETEGETRVEPGGLVLLCGQRIAANDLYRWCLDMSAMSVTELDAEGEDDQADAPRKYHHIVYKAHDEDRCSGDHQPKEAEPWPAGCLLDPVRIPWRELRHMIGSREQKFRVLYQQEDVDPAAVLIPKLWVDGGRDPSSGEVFAGCWDPDRRLCELPEGLRPPLVSIASADPSPTRFWAIGWWVVQPETGFRFLMDLERRSMDAPDFLDWSQATQSHSGLMESWQRRSVGLGLPIEWWVIEQNAAQRWLFQFEHFRTWQQRNGVRVIAHDTHRNKADAELGLEARLKPIFRDGLLRLPGSQDGVTRTAALKLVDEATRYPDCQTDDTLMMTWFMEHNLHLMTGRPPEEHARRSDVPGWMRDEVAA